MLYISPLVQVSSVRWNAGAISGPDISNCSSEEIIDQGEDGERERGRGRGAFLTINEDDVVDREVCYLVKT